jgi:hypothetical protein
MGVARISEDAKKDPAQFAIDVQNAEELVQDLTQEIRATGPPPTFYIHRRWMRVGFRQH